MPTRSPVPHVLLESTYRLWDGRCPVRIMLLKELIHWKLMSPQGCVQRLRALLQAYKVAKGTEDS